MSSLQCMHCKHLNDFGPGCAAFDDIPEEIYSGGFNHTQPWPSAEAPQDKGFRYEPAWEGIDDPPEGADPL